MNKMPNLTIPQFAALHGKESSGIRKMCISGKLKGATKLGRDWLIPAAAKLPVDGRTLRYKKASLTRTRSAA